MPSTTFAVATASSTHNGPVSAPGETAAAIASPFGCERFGCPFGLALRRPQDAEKSGLEDQDAAYGFRPSPSCVLVDGARRERDQASDQRQPQRREEDPRGDGGHCVSDGCISRQISGRRRRIRKRNQRSHRPINPIAPIVCRSLRSWRMGWVDLPSARRSAMGTPLPGPKLPCGGAAGTKGASLPFSRAVRVEKVARRTSSAA